MSFKKLTVPPSILNSIPDAAAIIDDKNNIIITNNALVNLFKFSRQELTSGKVQLKDLFSDIYRKIPLIDQSIHYTLFEMKTKDGSLINAAITVSSILKTRYRLIILRDMNDIAKAQYQGLSELYSTIKRKVAFIKFSFLDYGPVPEQGIMLDIIRNVDLVLNKMGVYYLTTIQDNFGLFGPFPVIDNSGLLSIVYKYEIDADKAGYKIKDERFEGKISSLIVIIFDKSVEALFTNRRDIRRIVQNIVIQEEYQSADPKIIEKMLFKIQETLFMIDDSNLTMSNRTFEQKLTLVNQVTRYQSDYNTIDEIYDDIADLAERVLNFEYFTAWYLDRSINALRLISKRGYDDLEISALDLNSKFIVCRCARTGEVQNIDDVTKDPDYYLGLSSIKAELAVPIFSMSKRTVVGVLNVETDDSFTNDDELLLEALAEKTAIFLEKEEVESRFLALSQLFSRVNSIDKKNINDLLKVICDFVESTYSFKYFSILLLDRNDLINMKAYIGYESDLSELKIPVDSKTSVIARCFQEQRSFNFGNVKQVSFYQCIDEKVNSEVCVPILIGNKVIGALNLESYTYNAFNRTDVRLLEALSKLVTSSSAILDYMIHNIVVSTN